MPTLQEIEVLTRTFAQQHKSLAETLQEIDSDLARVKRRHVRTLKAKADYFARAYARLYAAIESAPGLFERPKTVTIEGVRVGFQKGKGEIRFEDAGVVVKLIRKHLGPQADALIKTVETPIKAALAQLSAADLKRIGVTVEETGERVVIRPVAGEIDKLVDAFVKEAASQAREAAEEPVP